jgi:hypothetical protein
MGRGVDARLPSVGHPQFDLIMQESQAWLAARGQMRVGSGSFRAGPLAGSLHTDFGPAGQDKSGNQDYALAWWPADADGSGRPRLVLALADGLTASYRSECASALACWVAVRAIVEAIVESTVEAAASDAKDRAALAFNRAGQTIGRLADELAREPETSCPEGQFLSTWKYILKKGGLFQTTLTLAWLERDYFRIAMVGDGGALWRGYRGRGDTRQATCRVLAACDLDNQQVYALGPADRSVGQFDCWHEEQLDGPFLCALYTDGIGRGLGATPLALLDELESLQAAGADNPAQRFIEQAIAMRPRDFEDNLTLAVIRLE